MADAERCVDFQGVQTTLTSDSLSNFARVYVDKERIVNLSGVVQTEDSGREFKPDPECRSGGINFAGR